MAMNGDNPRQHPAIHSPGGGHCYFTVTAHDSQPHVCSSHSRMCLRLNAHPNRIPDYCHPLLCIFVSDVSFTLNIIFQTIFLHNSCWFYSRSLPTHHQSLWEKSPPNATGTCHSTRNPHMTGIRGPLGCGSLRLNARPMAPPRSPSSSGTAGSRFQHTFPLRQSSNYCRASAHNSLFLVIGVLFYHVWLAYEIINVSRSRSMLYVSLYLSHA